MFDKVLAIELAKLCLITEGVSLTDGLNEMKDQVTKLGYKYMHTIHGSQLATYFTPNLGEELMFGFVIQDQNGDYIVALRCTETFMDVMHDISFWQIPNPIKKAHLTFVSAGFSAIYQSLKVIEPGDVYVPLKTYLETLCAGTTSKVKIVGHSLGAALATLLGLDCSLNTGPLHSPTVPIHSSNVPIQCPTVPIQSPTVYTFGSPRVGDPLFAKLYNSRIKDSYRIAEKWDLVTKVPIIPAYYHVNEKIQVKRSWSLNPFGHHNLKTYIDCLEKME